MKQMMLKIGGMTCSACSSGLEKYLKKQPGIKDASINLVMSVATISYEGINRKEIDNYIKEAGFKSEGEFQGLNTSKEKTESKGKILVFGILLLFMMYISMGHMLGLKGIHNFVVTSDSYLSDLWCGYFKKWSEKSFAWNA